MQKSVVSVIVPVYNVEKYLIRCLDSIIHQTYSNLQIILIDDGSTDSSGEICDLYCARDTRIQVIHKSNGGLSSARNVGIENARGNYILFCDSDDYLFNDGIEYLVDLIKKYNAQVSIGNYIRTSEYIQRRNDPNEEDNLLLLNALQSINMQFGKDTVQMVTAWGKLFDASLFEDIRFPEGILHEDEAVMYRLFYKCEHVIRSDRIIYGYYFNPESITQKPKPQNYNDLCSVLKKQIEFYKSQHNYVLEARVRNRYAIQAMAHLLPKNYYGRQFDIIRDTLNVYKPKKILPLRDIPFIEKIKGLLCAYFSLPIACIKNSYYLLKSSYRSFEGITKHYTD